MISSRNRNIIVSSQFNINGSRGKDAGKFIRDYISRDSATDQATAYHHPLANQIQAGDGVAFTSTANAISRKELLTIADRVQELHQTGKRAIQQMVISFDPDYLVAERLVDSDLEVIKKGDYRGQYDDSRIRHAVRAALQNMIELEGYDDGRSVSCIQWDTRHLHVHTVVYENGKIQRWHYKEEKGVIRQSSLNQLTYEIDRNLENTKAKNILLVPSLKNMVPIRHDEPAKRKKANEPLTLVKQDDSLKYLNDYVQMMQAYRARQQQKVQENTPDKAPAMDWSIPSQTKLER